MARLKVAPLQNTDSFQHSLKPHCEQSAFGAAEEGAEK
jgi:hypothetical protein